MSEIKDASGIKYRAEHVRCQMCGWEFDLPQIPMTDAYTGAEWYCPHCGSRRPNDLEKLKVTIEVSGGVAECTDCPEGVEVQIIDHDDLEAEDAMKCKTCLTNADSLLGGECEGCRKAKEGK